MFTSALPAGASLACDAFWRVDAMPSRTEETPPRQRDRVRQPGSSRLEEARNFETQVSENGVNYDAPIGVDGEPLEEENINTHGSER
jgi:hypothetical protein